MARLQEWERDALVAAYKAGEKIEALCAEFGVTRSYPRTLSRRRRIPTRPNGRPSTKRAHPRHLVIALAT